jgi:hypothetical protein
VHRDVASVTTVDVTFTDDVAFAVEPADDVAFAIERAIGVAGLVS